MSRISTIPTSSPLKLIISQLQGLVRLMLEPFRLADIKPCFLCQGNSSIKVGTTLEFLLKLRIVLEFGKQR